MNTTDSAGGSAKFVSDPSVAAFSVPVQTYLSQHSNLPPGRRYAFIAAAAFVTDEASPRRMLLIQRAAGDSMPGRWEVPGGGCDDEDPSILHSVARELWEEAGLVATEIGPQVGDGYIFLTRSGKIVCKFDFLVTAKAGSDGELHVKLDPHEHQAYVWASEEEIRGYKAGNVDLVFTNEKQRQAILKAFETIRQAN